MRILFTTICFLMITINANSQCLNTNYYGVDGMDIGYAKKIIPTSDGYFVIAGQWNGQAYLRKVDSLGNTIAQQSYGTDIGGSSAFTDLLELANGSLIATGDCNHCAIEDTLKRVFVVQIDADLSLNTAIGVKKYGGLACCTVYIAQNNPSIAAYNDQLYISGQLRKTTQLDFTDFSLMRLSNTLDTLWSRHYNSCSNCGFDNPSSMAATSQGLALSINNTFTDSISVFHLDPADGTILWKKRLPWEEVENLAFLNNGQIAITGRTESQPGNSDVGLTILNEADGTVLDELTFGGPLSDEGRALKLLPNGNILLGMISIQPMPFGTYFTSRVYRIALSPLAIIGDYDLIPTQPVYNKMSLEDLLPLDAEGNSFVSCGDTDIPSRIFFHSKTDCFLPVCDREQDSLALVAFYNTLDGLDWNLTLPLDSFSGVTLNAEGCVEKIVIVSGTISGEFPNVELPHIKDLTIKGFGSGNCDILDNLEINTPIPNFCCMPQLENLELAFFKAITPVPNFTNLPKLKKLKIVARALNGLLPNLSNCPDLTDVRISGYTTTFLVSCISRVTEISGSIPNYTLPDVSILDFRYNRLSGSVPDFSNVPEASFINLLSNYLEDIPNLSTSAILNVQQNFFTFEDLLPYISQFSSYAPQRKIPVDPILAINANGKPEIDILIDENVVGSTYEWYKDGQLVGTTNENNFEINDPQNGNGIYRVEFINPGGPLLRLITEDFNIDICTDLLGSDPIEVDVTICEGDTFTLPDGSEVAITGDYEIALTSIFGCDSIIITHLTVDPSSEIQLMESICFGETFQFGDNTYSESGQYVIVLETVEGCDSTIHLDLLVMDNVQTDLSASICRGEVVEVGNMPFSESGQYVIVLETAEGCDSTIHLDLLVMDNVQTDLSASICPGEVVEVGNMPFSESGQYVIVLETAEGCDSTIHLDLLVSTEVSLSDVLIEGDNGTGTGSISPSFTGGLEPFEFQWSNGSNTAVNSDLATGPYTLVVTDANNCSYLFDFEVQMITSLMEVDNDVHIKVYPNPFGSYFFLEIDQQFIEGGVISVLDINGKEIAAKQNRIGNAWRLDVLDIPAGIYFVKVLLGGGKYEVVRVIKY